MASKALQQLAAMDFEDAVIAALGVLDEDDVIAIVVRHTTPEEDVHG